MKNKLIIFSLLVVISLGGVFFFKSTQVLSSTQFTKQKESHVTTELSIDEVKRIVTSTEWSAGLSDWSRSLDISECVENQCMVKVIFSTPQICPEDAKDDEWCDEVELSGKIQFLLGGFNFTDDKNAPSVFCNLKPDGVANNWKLEGTNCPESFTQLTGHPNNHQQ